MGYVRKDLEMCGGHNTEIRTIDEIQRNFYTLLAEVDRLRRIEEAARDVLMDTKGVKRIYDALREALSK